MPGATGIDELESVFLYRVLIGCLLANLCSAKIVYIGAKSLLESGTSAIRLYLLF